MEQNEEVIQQQSPKEENEGTEDELVEEKRESSSEAETDSEEEDDEDGETTEEESIEEDEPKLKYKRLEADISELLKKDAASAMSVSDRFVVCIKVFASRRWLNRFHSILIFIPYQLKALGTHNGDVLILDFDGNLNKRLSSHVASVTDIAIEVSGEYIASASLDGLYFFNLNFFITIYNAI